MLLPGSHADVAVAVAVTVAIVATLDLKSIVNVVTGCCYELGLAFGSLDGFFPKQLQSCKQQHYEVC